MLDQIIEIIHSKVSTSVEVATDENASPQAIVISTDHFIQIMEILYNDERLYFDMLSCITGLDNGLENENMEVIYNLYSVPFERALMIKVKIDRNSPEIPSVAPIWKTADWQEREVYDLFGIKFTGHPDLRRILMPADWEGYPLRKDYVNAATYRGMSIDFDRDDNSFDNPLNSK